VHLVGFGDRREAHDLPRLLRKNMADEIVLVQPLLAVAEISLR
jgi:hypothetical protein